MYSLSDHNSIHHFQVVGPLTATTLKLRLRVWLRNVFVAYLSVIVYKMHRVHLNLITTHVANSVAYLLVIITRNGTS